MNIILYNHAKNIKSESNFEMQSMEIKENQNNEIPFAEFAGWFWIFDGLCTILIIS